MTPQGGRRARAAGLAFVALLLGAGVLAAGRGDATGPESATAPTAAGEVEPGEAAEAAARDRPAWDVGLGGVVSPGPLARAHVELEGVTRCLDCHDWLGGTRDAACLACHEEIGARMERRVGFHGGLAGRCAGCHGDHRGRDADLLGLDREGFAHDQARFPLRGAHADVPCDDCHVRASAETGREAFHPIGAETACAGCHESPHAERLVRERRCEACHTAVAWSASVPPDPAAEVGFDHDADTRFPLDALHGGVPCVACHERGAEPPPPRACEACHRDAASLLAGRFEGRTAAPDPHAAPEADVTCTSCHPARVARPSLLDHAAACTSCHPASYASLLVSRRAWLDEALVAARDAADGAEQRRRLERLARSGLHHAELAEAWALALARRSP